ncbi:hypothetical protein [Roseiconus lacunae]|uniref:hypothetical protein n=1 Tax=Roseiconus lacunae TaxID=2605694 RepID=UPI0011F2C82A|nr:hypothetical protein [Roseiconus lacunae]
MNAASINQQSNTRQRSGTDHPMSVNWFDSVTACLTAIIVLLSCGTLIVLVLWLCTKALPTRMTTEVRSTVSSASMGVNESEFELPSIGEVSFLLEPSFEQTLRSVAAIPTSSDKRDATIGDIDFARVISRSSGPDVNASPAIERWQRWVLRFDSKNRDDYARQLDYFGIELGVFGGGQAGIESVAQLSKMPIRNFNSHPESETRLYFSWEQKSPFQVFDRDILNRAGVSTTGRNVVRFLPASLEEELLKLERSHCRKHSARVPDSIVKTVFECRKFGNTYRFEVIDQFYR